MNPTLVSGTVRARQGAMHTIVLPDGQRHDVILEGDEIPRIGGDVIGVFDTSSGHARMRLVKDVARLLLQGRTLISVSGRPEVTARMLARLFEGSGPAAVMPGVGGIIERTPVINDPDLAWAIDLLEPEARKLGLALNVIDPIALASSRWSDATFKEDMLPADATGGAAGLADLKRLMRDGFTPACRRTMEAFGRGRSVSSVDFILPYSPFATGHSFSADVGRAWRTEVARFPIPSADARRLSSFREISLAFAQRYMGRIKGDPALASHAEDAFADVAAVIAFVKTGGNVKSAANLAVLREAALARWDGTGTAPPATHGAIRSILAAMTWIETSTQEELLKQAASVAAVGVPKTREALARLAAAASDTDVFIDLSTCSPGTLRTVRRSYERDLDATLGRIKDAPKAIDRFARFGTFTVTTGLEEVFDAATERHSAAAIGFEQAAEDDAAIEEAFVPEDAAEADGPAFGF